MEDIIDRIKSHVRVHTDSEVAERIGLRKQELFQYKKKKTIPYKYLIEYDSSLTNNDFKSLKISFFV